MKKAIMLAGFAALLASPVLAQAPSGAYGTGNIIFPGDPARGRGRLQRPGCCRRRLCL